VKRQPQRVSPPIYSLGIVLIIAVALTVVLRRTNHTRTKSPTNSTPPSTSVLVSNAPLNISVVTPPTNRDDLLPDNPVQLLNYGTQLLNEGNVVGAVDLYSRALKLNPEDEEAHFNLAYAYTRLGRTNDAIKHYEDALKIFPDYTEAYNNLGNIYLAQKKYDQAIEKFSAALKISPESSSALNNLGRCLAEQGKTSEAIQYFSDAVRINPKYLEAHFNLGNAYANEGRHAEAIIEFNEVLRLRPNFPPAARALARSKEKVGAK